jgi:cell division protein FtsB
VVDHEDPAPSERTSDDARPRGTTLTRLRASRGRRQGDGEPEYVTSRTGSRFTARAALLLLVICGLAVTLAYPLQQYVSQRSQIAALTGRNARASAANNQLKQELADWNDPDYVRIQARLRLHYVLPGEIGFTVPGAAAPSYFTGGATGGPLLMPWYGRLWTAVTDVSSPPSGPPSPGPSNPRPQHVITDTTP